MIVIIAQLRNLAPGHLLAPTVTMRSLRAAMPLHSGDERARRSVTGRLQRRWITAPHRGTAAPACQPELITSVGGLVRAHPCASSGRWSSPGGRVR